MSEFYENIFFKMDIANIYFNNYFRIKKVKILFFFFLLFVVSCTKTQKEYYPSGKIEKEYELKDGVADGWWREYYEDGMLKFDGIVRNGEMQDSCFKYHENGALSIKGFYKDGVAIGDVFYYDKFGFLKEKSWRTGRKYYQEYYNPDGVRERIDEFLMNDTTDIEKAILNQYILFNEKGDTLYDKSRFVRLFLNKDTVYLGDTLKVNVELYSNYREDMDFGMVVFLQDPIDPGDKSKFVIEKTPLGVHSIEISYAASKVGKCDLMGSLTEMFENGKFPDQGVRYFSEFYVMER